MKLHYVSDLHLSHLYDGALDVLPVVGDVLVLAGDISDSLSSLVYLERIVSGYTSQKLPVLLICGNHEFYNRDRDETLEVLRAWCETHRVVFLNDSYIDLGDVRVFGTTLWTDFSLYDTPAISMEEAAVLMSDFSTIRDGAKKITPELTRQWHRKACQTMRDAFTDFKGSRVVISHHAPHARSISPLFRGHPINPGFVSDLSVLIRDVAPNVWIHGHVHQSHDYFVGNTRVVANPRGYPHKNGPENGSFDVARTVDVN